MNRTKVSPNPGSEWRRGTLDKNLIYVICVTLFSFSIYLDFHHMKVRGDKMDNTDIIIVGSNLVGFMFLIIYQVINKWIFGIIAIALPLLVNAYVFYQVLLITRSI
jgi:hypothetical protein